MNSKLKNLLDQEKENKHLSRLSFEGGVLASKFGLIITLLIISFINADGVFVCNKTREFLSECILVGMSAVVSTLFLALNRGYKGAPLANACFVVFMLFFIFHILMEFSGANNMETQELNEGDEKQQEWIKNNVFNKTVYAIIGIGFIAMTVLSYRVSDYNIGKEVIDNKLQWTKKGRYKFIAELVAFGLINASPALLITHNRGASNHEMLKSFGLTAGMYSSLYWMLEAGGFFTNTMGTLNKIEKLH